MEAWWRDLRAALRRLRKSPGFVLATVVSLGLGIGANTAVFSLLDALMFRPLPVRDPQRLVRLGSLDSRGLIHAVPAPMFDWLRQDGLFEGVCGVSTPLTTVEVNDAPLPMSGLALTGGCYEMLGVRPALGRLFTRADDVPTGPPVVVLGYDFWQRQYGGDPKVLGQSLRLEGVPFTIIGVTEPRFQGFLLGFPPSVSFPIAQQVSPLRASPPTPQTFYWGSAFARLKAGVTAEEAQTQLRVDWRRQLDAALPPQIQGQERTEELNAPLVVTSGSTGLDYSMRNRFRRPLGALLAISVLVLLLSCINVANLLLARGLERRREIAVRRALGAGRWQIVRELVAESAVLVVAAIGGGLLLAAAGNRVLLTVLGRTYSGFVLTASADSRVWLFTAACGLAALLLFGVLPARQTTAAHLTEALKAGSRSSLPAHTRMRRILICGQVALTLVLVVAAGFLLETFRRLRGESLGFQTEQVLNVQLVPLPGGYAQGFSPVPYYRQLLDRMQSLPGVEAASLSHFSPVFSISYDEEIRSTLSPDAPGIHAATEEVSDGFLATLRIPLLQGRDFQRTDSPQTQKTAIISESLAKRLFPGGAALGRHISVGAQNDTRDLEIIGIAADARLFDPRTRDFSFVYMDSWQHPDHMMWGNLQLRYRGDSQALSAAVRRELRNAGHEYPLHLRTIAAQRDNALLQERLLANLSAAFGGLALTLAGVGLFGLLNLLVTSRRSEIAIRMALGAGRGDVSGMIVRETLALVGGGMLLGLPLSFAAVRVLSNLLYGEATLPMVPLALSIALLSSVAALATVIPVRRATSVDPMVALRCE